MTEAKSMVDLDRIIPAEVYKLLESASKVRIFNNYEELADASTGVKEKEYFEVKYDLGKGKGVYTEAIVHRVKNGISANYTEAYMRRRDPETMSVADDKPTDKARFSDRYGYPFEILRKETIDWLKKQELGVFFYFAGRENIGAAGLAIGPVNAAFFLMGLGMLQRIIPVGELDDKFDISSVVYVAPPFRHTHFGGKQAVIHNRKDDLHEVYAYNLYPGPSAKKGLYGVLLTKGENEGWITTHCSTVQVKSPYDNITTFMHEGASGGGKSEMLQHILRTSEGQVLIGRNTISGEERKISIPTFCSFAPVTDDMALCPPSIQGNNGKLTVLDAENSWFIRVDGVKDYGDDPFMEKTTIKAEKPVLFINIDTKPGCTALIWDHIEDEPGKRCPNPRAVVPREIVPEIINKPVTIDVRSFGVRTPPSCIENPGYGIIGMFHILPLALAWLWRLVSPRGYANPSITDSGNMHSEGVGSYWPFATGKRVKQANLLLEQIIQTPRVRYVLTPNQHIGVWDVGFKPQLLMREYLTRRGNAKLRSDQYQPAECSLLGYELNYLTIEGAEIPSRFLKVYRQPEVGNEGYNKGAEILHEFFMQELKNFKCSEMTSTGRRIIEACYDSASVEEYNSIIPMNYEYSFLTFEDYEHIEEK